MTEFRQPRPAEEHQLRVLWNRAFREEEDFLTCFFSRAYRPSRCRVAVDREQVLAMLYWFDCQWKDRKLAYLYAVATDPGHQGRGIASALLRDTHRHLEDLGYAGAILVPGGRPLFRFYEKLGYQTNGFLSEFRVPSGAPVPVREIGPEEYGRLRRLLLPENGVIQEGENLTFLHSMARLYAGSGSLAAVSREQQGRCLELLGDVHAAPGILGALGIPEAPVRTPGKENPFAMTFWFGGLEPPGELYFGLAFD